MNFYLGVTDNDWFTTLWPASNDDMYGWDVACGARMQS